jgi:hypothetical protein
VRPQTTPDWELGPLGSKSVITQGVVDGVKRYTPGGCQEGSRKSVTCVSMKASVQCCRTRRATHTLMHADCRLVLANATRVALASPEAWLAKTVR